MTDYEEMLRLAREGRRDDCVSINSPVTVVEGEGRGANCGPTINLQQYTDYVLRKFLQQQSQWEDAGLIPSYGSMTYAKTGQNTNQPLMAIGSTTADAMFTLTAGLICTLADAGAGTLTLSVTYFDPVTGSNVISITQALTGAGSASSGPTVVFLLAGSTVTVSVVNSGTYGASKYDAFVSLQRTA